MFDCDFDLELGIGAALKGLSIPRSDLDDVRQAAAEAMVKEIPRLNREMPPPTQGQWLIRAGRWAAQDCLRNLRRAQRLTFFSAQGWRESSPEHEGVETLFSGVPASIADESEPPPSDRFERFERESALGAALATLSERTRTIIRRSFGFDETGEATMDAIGAEQGTSGQNIRAIRARALARLRESEFAPTLRLFLEA